MKTSIRFFFLALSMIVFGTCDDGYKQVNYKNQPQRHNYKQDKDDFVATSFRKEKNDGPAPRELWQRPKLVLKKLGSLEGKIVADIGAGPYGFFTIKIALETAVEKVIAIDIDREAIQFIENLKVTHDEAVRDRIETRLAKPNDPKLEDEEVDIVLIVNTYFWLPSHVDYLKNLKKGLSKDGRIFIIDYKKKITPLGPPDKVRISMGKVEQDLMKAGYVDLESDDESLEYQYIVSARANANVLPD